MSMCEISTGIDLVEVARLDDLKDNIRQRFIERVYTPSEIQLAGGSNVNLAEIFAAKEAVAKTLGCGIGDVSWQDIEVSMGETGVPVVYLHGAAKQIADRQGFRTWRLSLSHTPVYALAFVAASR